MVRLRRGTLHSLRPHLHVLSAALLISAAFVLLKAPALRPAISDENIYFYMAWRVSEGALPYRDFFYANPPGLLLPGAVLTFLFGPSFPVLKSLPMLAALGALVFTFLLIARRAGAAAGLLCVAAWMLAETFLRASSHWTGVNVTTFFLVLAVFLLQRGNTAASGFMVALAGLTKTYGFAALPALWAGSWARGKPDHRRFLLGFFPVTLAANGLLLLLSGREFIRQTIRYHLAKPPDPESNVDALRTVVAQSWPWLLAAAVGLLLSLHLVRPLVGGLAAPSRGRDRAAPKPDTLPLVCFVFILSFVAFMAVQKRVFSFYVLPLFPILCLLLGEGNRRLDEKANAWRNRLPFLLRRIPAAAWLIIPIAVSLTHVPPYLSHEIDFGFPEAFPMARFVRGTTGSGETLFGYSGVAPLVALLAGRRLADDEADTNAMRFRSGIDDVEDVFRRAERDRLRYLATIWRRNRDHVGIFRISAFQRLVRGRYRTVRTWPGDKGTYILLEREPEG